MIRTKLERLERVHHGVGKLAVVSAGDQTDEQVDAILRGVGVDPDTRDNLVVVIRSSNEIAELLYVMDLH